ncbi:MAG: peptidase domain-containing ABC transporter, partial [Methylococcales bacterium]|nr:peptidase domain-containing ABC transporter [Methylococcales bacterium]
MVMIAIFKTLSVTVQSLLLAHTTARIDLRMMSEFYRHVLSLPMGFFLTRNKGEILARFGENQKIRAIIAGSTITVVLNTVMVVLYFMMMFTYNSGLTLIVMFFIPMYITITLYFTPKIKAISQQIFLTGAQQQGHLIESLNGIEAIKATANEYFARSRWENSFVSNVNMGYRQAKIALLSSSLNQLVGLAASVSVLWYGANEVMDGNMTIGELMGFNMLMGLVVGPILQMVGLWNSALEVSIAVDRVSDVLNVKSEQPPISNPNHVPSRLDNCRGRITFEKACFSYMAGDKEHYIMNDFDLVIESGTRVAFVGASGCGKSTIAKMVLGFNMPKSGQCLIDGKEIRSLDLDNLRQNIGVVLQDSFIFSGTVAQNIAFGDPEPDMQVVKEAAESAGADEFIINYPVGYQTLIGEKGMGISGGQRQRICIARALYRKPTIMIFDEATSALDNDSEARIQANMETILKGKTSITIAHRLSTIIDSDMICYIKDGKVNEKGTHEQLIDPEFIKKNNYEGHYYGLAKGQFDLPELDLKKEE